MHSVPCTLLLFFLVSCSGVNSNVSEIDRADVQSETIKIKNASIQIDKNIDNSYKSVAEIPVPAGYSRVKNRAESFGDYLRNISLKKDNTVYLYNGQKKSNQHAQFAVLDISVQNRDLQQCADAVMRLRAEHLYANKAYDEILFIDNEGGRYPFSPPYTRANFDKYLLRVFGWCGTASLSKQMKTQSWTNLQPGDVLIKGGFPGHAVIVMDVAKNDSGKKIYLLAQSYMPAQSIHILVNPSNKKLSPWYEVNNDSEIPTPEWTFTRSQLKTW